MKLADWPLSTECHGGQVCGYQVPHPKWPDRLHDCAADLGSDTVGGLLTSIVEHARDQHGIGIEREGVWYKAFCADGRLFDQGPNVAQMRSAATDADEWDDGAVTPLGYQRVSVYTLSVAEEWKPDGDTTTA